MVEKTVDFKISGEKAVLQKSCRCFTSIKYKVERYKRYLYRVRSFGLQPLSAGNSTEFLEADNSKTATTQTRQSDEFYIIELLM